MKFTIRMLFERDGQVLNDHRLTLQVADSDNYPDSWIDRHLDEIRDAFESDLRIYEAVLRGGSPITGPR